MLRSSLKQKAKAMNTFPGHLIGVARVLGSVLILAWALESLPGPVLLNVGYVVSPVLAVFSSLLYLAVLSCMEGWRYWVEARRQGIEAQGLAYWTRAFMRSRPWVFLLPVAIAAEAAMYLGGKSAGCKSRPMIRTLVGVRLLGLLIWVMLCGLSLDSPAVAALLHTLPVIVSNSSVWLGFSILGIVIFLAFERRQGRSMPWKSIGLALLSAVLLSGVTELSAVAAGVPLSMMEVIGFLGLLNFALVLPISLGGLGIQEALLLNMCSQTGAQAEQILTLSILLHLQRIFLALIGGFMQISHRR